MIAFYIRNEGGDLVRTGTVKSAAQIERQAGPGESAHEGKPPTDLLAVNLPTDPEKKKRVTRSRRRAEKKRAILAIASEAQQRNNLARRLALIEDQIKGASLSDVEKKEADKLRALWDQIREIRQSE